MVEQQQDFNVLSVAMELVERIILWIKEMLFWLLGASIALFHLLFLWCNIFSVSLALHISAILQQTGSLLVLLGKLNLTCSSLSISGSATKIKMSQSRELLNLCYSSVH